MPHKVAFKGSIDYFKVLEDTFSDIILRAALLTPARLLRDNEVRDHNGKVIGENIITPLDIICMNNNKPLLQYLITRRIINESLLKANYQFEGELNDSIIKLSNTKTINDEFKVLLQRHMFSITPQSFSLRTWTRKIEHYIRIMPSLTEAIDITKKACQLENHLFLFDKGKSIIQSEEGKQVNELLADVYWQPSLIEFVATMEIIRNLNITILRNGKSYQLITNCHDMLFFTGSRTEKIHKYDVDTWLSEHTRSLEMHHKNKPDLAQLSNDTNSFTNLLTSFCEDFLS